MICPSDYKTHPDGPILDTLLHQKLVEPLPTVSTEQHMCIRPLPARVPFSIMRYSFIHGMQGVVLLALIDSCHSGTVMNLPYNAVLRNGVMVDWEAEYPGQSDIWVSMR